MLSFALLSALDFLDRRPRCNLNRVVVALYDALVYQTIPLRAQIDALLHVGTHIHPLLSWWRRR